MQRTAEKCTKFYNARAEPLFRSLNLLFYDVLVAVAVAVVVCLKDGSHCDISISIRIVSET